jgi:hypothetical protein
MSTILNTNITNTESFQILCSVLRYWIKCWMSVSCQTDVPNIITLRYITLCFPFLHTLH